MKNALIDQIKKSTLFATVKGYKGEFKDATKLADILPAALVVFKSGFWPRSEKRGGFDILICTQTLSFDEEADVDNNLSLCDGLMEYFHEHLVFTYEGKQYSFNIDEYQAQETDHPFTAKLVGQTERFTVVALHVSILT